MPERSLASKVLRGFTFTGAGTFVSKLVFIGALFWVLKLISKEELGIASLALAVLAILGAISEMGIGRAIVQKTDVEREDIDSLFWVTLGLSVGLCLILIGVAPLIAWFYEEPGLTDLLRVYSATLIVFPLYFIPKNLLIKRLAFARMATIEFVPVLVASGVMVWLAHRGFGPWAIILGDLTIRTGQLILSNLFNPYWPRLAVDLRRVKGMLKFGAYVTGARLLFNIRSNVDYLIVGKVYGAEKLGLYTVAFRMVVDLIRILVSIINQVAFPTFAKLQDQLERLRKYFFTIARFSLALFGQMLIVVAVFADWILIAFGYEQYLPAVPIVHVLAVMGAFRAVTPLVAPLLQARGRADLNFHFSLWSTILVPVACLIGASISLIGVAWAWVVVVPILTGIQVLFGARVLQMSFWAFGGRFLSGALELAPTLGIALALRWLLADALPGHPKLVLIAVVSGFLVLAVGLVAWWERATIRLLRASRRKGA